MIARYVLKSGEKRVLLVTHVYSFGPPETARPGQPDPAIWDRRHEGLINGIVVLDPHFDNHGVDYDGNALGGMFLPVYQVVYDPTGKPGTYSDDIVVPIAGPAAPSPEYLAALDAARARGQTVEQARAEAASIGG